MSFLQEQPPSGKSTQTDLDDVGTFIKALVRVGKLRVKFNRRAWAESLAKTKHQYGEDRFRPVFDWHCRFVGTSQWHRQVFSARSFHDEFIELEKGYQRWLAGRPQEVSDQTLDFIRSYNLVPIFNPEFHDELPQVIQHALGSSESFFAQCGETFRLLWPKGVDYDRAVCNDEEWHVVNQLSQSHRSVLWTVIRVRRLFVNAQWFVVDWAQSLAHWLAHNHLYGRFVNFSVRHFDESFDRMGTHLCCGPFAWRNFLREINYHGVTDTQRQIPPQLPRHREARSG